MVLHVSCVVVPEGCGNAGKGTVLQRVATVCANAADGAGAHGRDKHATAASLCTHRGTRQELAPRHCCLQAAEARVVGCHFMRGPVTFTAFLTRARHSVCCRSRVGCRSGLIWRCWQGWEPARAPVALLASA